MLQSCCVVSLLIIVYNLRYSLSMDYENPGASFFSGGKESSSSLQSSSPPSSTSSSFSDASEDEDTRNHDFVANELIAINEEHECMLNKLMYALWFYHTNMTEENLSKLETIRGDVRRSRIKIRNQAVEFLKLNLHSFHLNWQLHQFSLIGEDVLPDVQYEQYNQIIKDMVNYIENIKIPEFNNRTNLLGFEEVQRRVKFSSNWTERKHYWITYHNSFQQESRTHFHQMSQLISQAAYLHGFDDVNKYYFRDYYQSNLNAVAQLLFRRIRRVYAELHAYVRHQLRMKFGTKFITRHGHIPINAFGDLWAENWLSIYEDTKPFKYAEDVNMTKVLIEQNFTVVKMAKVADTFFSSLFMDDLQKPFWKNSIFEKPTDGRKFDCTPTAWDFYTGDFRISMCGKVDGETFSKFYELMAHIQYMSQYQRQKPIFRKAPTPAFQEAFSYIPSLSVNSLAYLRKMKFLQEEPSEEQFINYLYKLALEKLVMIPYAFSIDAFRWNVLNKTVGPEEYNVRFWKIKRYYTGIGPACFRSEENLDLAGNLHFAKGIPFIDHFMAQFTSFLIHDELCKVAVNYEYVGNPADFDFNKCDIFGAKKAGEYLSRVLQLGAAHTWTRTLYMMTSERKVRETSLLRFFDPLIKWIMDENVKTRQKAGWV